MVSWLHACWRRMCRRSCEIYMRVMGTLLPESHEVELMGKSTGLQERRILGDGLLLVKLDKEFRRFKRLANSDR